MPTPEEEFDAALAAHNAKSPEEEAFDAELAGASAPVAPVELGRKEPPPAVEPPWYRQLAGELSQNPWIGNMLREAKSPDNIPVTRQETRDGVPATIEGDTVPQSIERENDEISAAHPTRHVIGQVAQALPGAVAASELGAAAMGRLAPSVPKLAAAAGRAIGGGATYTPQVFANQEGDVAHRAGATINHMIDHPVEASIGTAAPAVLEGATGPLTKAGGKLVAKGNEGLAKIGLGGTEINRLKGLGLGKLADTGQKIRDAGLDKSRTLMDYFSPTKAKTLYENASDKIAELGGNGAKAGSIRNLEDKVLASPAKALPHEAITDGPPRSLGETPIDTTDLVSQLRGEAGAAENSAEVTGEKTARDFRRQADKFPTAEPVGFERQIARPPALPRYEAFPDMGAEPNPLMGADLPPPSVEAPPVQPPGPVQQSLDLKFDPQQRQIPLEGGQTAFDYGAFKKGALATPQAPVDLSPPQLPLPNTDLGPAPRPERRVATNARGGGVQMNVTGYEPKAMPPLPPDPTQGVLPGLETQQRLPGVPSFPSGKGLTPNNGTPAGVPMPAAPGSVPLGPDRAINLEAPTTTGEFGGSTETIPAAGELEKQFNLAKAIQDRRQIGKRLFDKKQRVGGQSFGQDAARQVAWSGLDDSIESTLDNAHNLADVEPGLLDDYRTARKDFTPAMGLLKGGVAGKAEQELKASASTLGWLKNGTSALSSPGTKYNTGRGLEMLGGGASKAAPVAAAGAAQNKADSAKNESMKQSIFTPWYQSLLGAKPKP